MRQPPIRTSPGHADSGARAPDVDERSAAASLQVAHVHVRKSTLYLANPEVLGVEMCSWAPEKSSTSPGAGRTMRSLPSGTGKIGSHQLRDVVMRVLGWQGRPR